MSRVLPPAKRGVPSGGRLQHSSKSPPLDFSKITVRPYDAEMRATAEANVQQAKERAGLGTPELQAAHHADIQQHVPRMINWINERDRKTMAGPGPEPPPRAFDSSIYIRPGDTGHSTH